METREPMKLGIYGPEGIRRAVLSKSVPQAIEKLSIHERDPRVTTRRSCSSSLPEKRTWGARRHERSNGFPGTPEAHRLCSPSGPVRQSLDLEQWSISGSFWRQGTKMKQKI